MNLLDMINAVKTLKPCPFCGGKAKLSQRTSRDFDGNPYTDNWIHCTRCRAAIRAERNVLDAIDAWNTRF